LINGWLNFLVVLNDDVETYICVCACLIVIYFIVYRNLIEDIFDPFLLVIIAQFFAATVVFFMYLKDMMLNEEDFVIFIITEISLFGGLHLFEPNFCYRNNSIISKNDNKMIHLICKIYLLMFSILDTIKYATYGIPIISAKEPGMLYYGGNGIVETLTATLQPTLLIVCFILLIKNEMSLFEKIMFFYSSICILLSGSKAGLLGLLGCMYFSVLYFKYFDGYYNDIDKKISYIKRRVMLIVSVSIAIGFLGYSISKATEDNAFLLFLYRLVASGDIYAYVYAESFQGLLNVDDWFYMLFGNAFAVLRLIPYEQIPLDLGGQIKQIIFNTSENIGGANARPEVLGFYLFGEAGSVIFNFIVGSVISFFRSRYVMALWPKNIIFFIGYILIYSTIIKAITDPIMAIRLMPSILLINGIIGVMVCYVQRKFN